MRTTSEKFDKIRRETLDKRINQKVDPSYDNIYYGRAKNQEGHNLRAAYDEYLIEQIANERGDERRMLDQFGSQLSDRYGPEHTKKNARIENIKEGNRKEAQEFVRNWNGKMRERENPLTLQKNNDEYVVVTPRIRTPNPYKLKNLKRNVSEALDAAEYANGLMEKYL